MGWICKVCETLNDNRRVYCEVCNKSKVEQFAQDAYEELMRSPTISSCDKFLLEFPQTEWAGDIIRLREKLRLQLAEKEENQLWIETKATNTIVAYNNYLTKTKLGRYKWIAKAQIDILRTAERKKIMLNIRNVALCIASIVIFVFILNKCRSIDAGGNTKSYDIASPIVPVGNAQSPIPRNGNNGERIEETPLPDANSHKTPYKPKTTPTNKKEVTESEKLARCKTEADYGDFYKNTKNEKLKQKAKNKLLNFDEQLWKTALTIDLRYKYEEYIRSTNPVAQYKGIASVYIKRCKAREEYNSHYYYAAKKLFEEVKCSILLTEVDERKYKKCCEECAYESMRLNVDAISSISAKKFIDTYPQSKYIPNVRGFYVLSLCKEGLFDTAKVFVNNHTDIYWQGELKDQRWWKKHIKIEKKKRKNINNR